MADLDYRGYWDGGFTWAAYMADEVQTNRALWEGVARGVRLPAWALERAAAAGGSWKLLVISEDWCGDASNTVPVIAALAEAAPELEMRVVKRDENPELMDEYLTGESRSIPLAVLLDEQFRPRGRWGPRPAELQEFVMREKSAGTRPPAEIYRDVRSWYARDRGASTLREVLEVIEAAGSSR
jgi:hypothetical protein